MQDTKKFINLAPFQPFLGKFGQNSATDLLGHLQFYLTLLEIYGPRIGQLGTLLLEVLLLLAGHCVRSAKLLLKSMSLS
jgi:hypothetical protein